MDIVKEIGEVKSITRIEDTSTIRLVIDIHYCKQPGRFRLQAIRVEQEDCSCV